jgi:LAO/AO transport system kinase
VNGYVPSASLIDRVMAGEVHAIARLISRAEAGYPEDRAALAQVYRGAGKGHVIGITGVPGSGKSTLVARLAQLLRTQGGRIGIIAVDPSSPYSGGSILGDRVRMTELGNDPDVYIRSMATRGATGGMARATLDAVDILDLAGFHTIIIETVGVGQDEVEIARASNTTIVVSSPGLGDEIQAIKAGMLEIADIHVVTKCDRSDSNRTLSELKQMLTMGIHGRERPDWEVPVVGVSSFTGEGLDKLVTLISQHQLHVQGTAAGRARQLEIAAFRLQKTAETLLSERFLAAAAAFAPELSQRLLKRDSDPYTLATELLALTMGHG